MVKSIEEVNKLPVEERADLFLALSIDKEVIDYLAKEERNSKMFAEIDRRDKAFKMGVMPLTSTDDLSLRLKMRRDAL